MTLAEIEEIINCGTAGHEVAYMRLNEGFVCCDTALLMRAWEQIKRNIDLCMIGIVDSKDHSAEALLLMILRDCYYHGYTLK